MRRLLRAVAVVVSIGVLAVTFDAGPAHALAGPPAPITLGGGTALGSAGQTLVATATEWASLAGPALGPLGFVLAAGALLGGDSYQYQDECKDRIRNNNGFPEIRYYTKDSGGNTIPRQPGQPAGGAYFCNMLQLANMLPAAQVAVAPYQRTVCAALRLTPEQFNNLNDPPGSADPWYRKWQDAGEAAKWATYIDTACPPAWRPYLTGEGPAPVTPVELTEVALADLPAGGNMTDRSVFPNAHTLCEGYNYDGSCAAILNTPPGAWVSYPTAYVTLDLSKIVDIGYLRLGAYAQTCPCSVAYSYSTNGNDYAPMHTFPASVDGAYKLTRTISARFIKAVLFATSGVVAQGRLEVYPPAGVPKGTNTGKPSEQGLVPWVNAPVQGSNLARAELLNGYSCQSTYDGSCANIFDGPLQRADWEATGWAGYAPNAVTMDFGSGGVPDIWYLGFHANGFRRPWTFRIESSTDGANWTERLAATQLYWMGAMSYLRLPAKFAARYLRFIPLVTVPESGVGINRLEVYRDFGTVLDVPEAPEVQPGADLTPPTVPPPPTPPVTAPVPTTPTTVGTPSPATEPLPGDGGVLDGLSHLGNRILGGLTSLGSFIVNGVVNGLGSLLGAIGGLLQAILSEMRALAVWGVNAITAAVGAVVSAISALGSGVKLLLGQILNAIGDLVIDPLVNVVVSPVVDVLGGLGDLLVGLVVPTSAQVAEVKADVQERVSSTGPGSVVIVAVGLLDAFAGAVDTGLGKPPCGPTIGFDGVDGPVGASLPGFRVRMPSPAPCPGNGPGGARTDLDEQASNLAGYRELVRGLVTFALVVGIALDLARSAPWAKGANAIAPGSGPSPMVVTESIATGASFTDPETGERWKVRTTRSGNRTHHAWSRR